MDKRLFTMVDMQVSQSFHCDWHYKTTELGALTNTKNVETESARHGLVDKLIRKAIKPDMSGQTEITWAMHVVLLLKKSNTQ